MANYRIVFNNDSLAHSYFSDVTNWKKVGTTSEIMKEMGPRKELTADAIKKYIVAGMSADDKKLYPIDSIDVKVEDGVVYAKVSKNAMKKDSGIAKRNRAIRR